MQRMKLRGAKQAGWEDRANGEQKKRGRQITQIAGKECGELMKKL